MIWQDYFKAPFHSDEYGMYCFDSEDNICLQYDSDRTGYNGHILKEIVCILNGISVKCSYDINKATVVKNATDCFVMFENGDCLTVRAWGYLTGVKHLSNKDAAAVQDSFLDYIVNKIKESQK